MTRFGRSLQLYFVDGRPDGMLTAEVFNWTGHVLMTPRTQIAEALKRTEAGFTGVYLLLGERDGQPLCYIGEAEDMAFRLREHVRKRDWWTQAVMVTSSANNLHKAHIKYLESRMVEEGLKIGHIPLENGNTPPRSSLSEADRSNMEAFFETLRMVLSAIRIDIFLEKRRPSGPAGQSNISDKTPGFVYESRKHDIQARAMLEDGEFVVLAGSKARREWSGTSGHNYHALFETLRTNGILVASGEHCIFSENYAFSSPSAAGAVVVGRATNGQTSWKTEIGGKSYRDWESDQVDLKVIES